jgi:hypothetical protein
MSTGVASAVLQRMERICGTGLAARAGFSDKAVVFYGMPVI